jgi:hypothetical protein
MALNGPASRVWLRSALGAERTWSNDGVKSANDPFLLLAPLRGGHAVI